MMVFCIFAKQNPSRLTFKITIRQWNLFKHKILIPVSLDPC